MVMIFAYSSIVYQMKKNLKMYSKLEKRIDRYDTRDIADPMMRFTESPGSPYMKAYDQIIESPHTRFWVVGDNFHLLMRLNYAIYPREAHFSVETQKSLYDEVLRQTGDPINHIPPQQYDEKVVVEKEQPGSE